MFTCWLFEFESQVKFADDKFLFLLVSLLTCPFPICLVLSSSRILTYVFGGFGSLLIGSSIICFIAWKPLGNPNPQVSNLALAIVLLCVAIVQAGFNAFQDFSTSKIMQSIGGLLPSEVTVLRNGSRSKIPAAECVDLGRLRLNTVGLS